MTIRQSYTSPCNNPKWWLRKIWLHGLWKAPLHLVNCAQGRMGKEQTQMPWDSTEHESGNRQWLKRQDNWDEPSKHGTSWTSQRLHVIYSQYMLSSIWLLGVWKKKNTLGPALKSWHGGTTERVTTVYFKAHLWKLPVPWSEMLQVISCIFSEVYELSLTWRRLCVIVGDRGHSLICNLDNNQALEYQMSKKL